MKEINEMDTTKMAILNKRSVVQDLWVSVYNEQLKLDWEDTKARIEAIDPNHQIVMALKAEEENKKIHYHFIFIELDKDANGRIKRTSVNNILENILNIHVRDGIDDALFAHGNISRLRNKKLIAHLKYLLHRTIDAMERGKVEHDVNEIASNIPLKQLEMLLEFYQNPEAVTMEQVRQVIINELQNSIRFLMKMYSKIGTFEVEESNVKGFSRLKESTKLMLFNDVFFDNETLSDITAVSYFDYSKNKKVEMTLKEFVHMYKEEIEKIMEYDFNYNEKDHTLFASDIDDHIMITRLTEDKRVNLMASIHERTEQEEQLEKELILDVANKFSLAKATLKKADIKVLPMNDMPEYNASVDGDKKELLGYDVIRFRALGQTMKNKIIDTIMSDEYNNTNYGYYKLNSKDFRRLFNGVIKRLKYLEIIGLSMHNRITGKCEQHYVMVDEEGIYIDLTRDASDMFRYVLDVLSSRNTARNLEVVDEVSANSEELTKLSPESEAPQACDEQEVHSNDVNVFGDEYIPHMDMPMIDDDLDDLFI